MITETSKKENAILKDQITRMHEALNIMHECLRLAPVDFKGDNEEESEWIKTWQNAYSEAILNINN